MAQMIDKSLFTPKFKAWILAAVVLVISGQMSLSHGAGHVLVWPLGEIKAGSEANVSPKSHEIRKGRISISPEIMPQASGTASQSRIAISRGDTVTLTFFADVTYKVAVDAVTYHPDDIITISGGLHDHMNRTVVLTIGPASFLITLQDVNRALLYRVTGDSGQASGTVTEIDMSKIPPMIR